MTVGSVNKWLPPRKAGGRTRFSLSVENEQDDAGRDCQTCLARQIFSRANGGRDITIFPVQLTTSRIGYYTVDPFSPINDDHTYIHTNILGGSMRVE